MGPAAALTSCLTGVFRFRGRATRAEFWWSWAILYPLTTLLMGYRRLLSQPEAIALTAVLTVIAVAMVAVGTRRLADAGLWRWFFVVTFLFGLVAQLVYRIPVPDLEALSSVMLQFDDGIIPASELGHYRLIAVIQWAMPWIGRPLAILCLLLALLPTRRADRASDFAGVPT